MSALAPQDVAEISARAMWAEDRASAGLGMAIERVGPGEAVLTMTVTEAMTNGHGIAHGGFLFALADSAFAFACNSRGAKAVAQHNTITYLAPGRLGDRLTATARETARAGRGGVYDVAVVNQDGVQIAVFRGACRLVSGDWIEAASANA